MGGNVRKKRLLQQHKFGAEKRMELSTPVAYTPLAQRMLDVLGPDDFSVIKTFQQQFGAKLVHYADQAGEVGKRQGWTHD
jgi:hypothetical protein